MRKFALSLMVSFVGVLGFGAVASAQYLPPIDLSTTPEPVSIPATGLADIGATVSVGFLLIGVGLIAVARSRAALAKR